MQSKKLSSIGTFTAGVAHQLNNPLHNISTSCQIAAQAINGFGRIIISAREDESADEVIIEVHDTGPGIPEEIQRQFFAPF